jgi:hypothetical protein
MSVVGFDCDCGCRYKPKPYATCYGSYDGAEKLWTALDVEDDLFELGAYGVHGFERLVFEDFLRIFTLEIFSLDKIQGSQW